jgi:hypothetical protein
MVRQLFRFAWCVCDVCAPTRCLHTLRIVLLAYLNEQNCSFYKSWWISRARVCSYVDPRRQRGRPVSFVGSVEMIELLCPAGAESQTFSHAHVLCANGGCAQSTNVDWNVEVLLDLLTRVVLPKLATGQCT